ncbi:MAG TPA: trehalose-6-phosphate synthase, partial [Acidimicrobiales bacterium]
MDDRPTPQPVVAVACKPPVVPHRDGWKPAAGGLAPIVRAALADRGGTWVSWDGGCPAPPSQLPGVHFGVRTFPLRNRDAQAFYGGYANRTLWPLLHELDGSATFESGWWQPYHDVNTTFASAAAAAIADVKQQVWVHDYHLLLVPSALRDAGTTNRIAFFLHTPFPAPSVFARVPQRSELLRGLAGADLLGFQTAADRERFAGAWSEFASGDLPATTVTPASIDVEMLTTAARDERVARGAHELRKRFFGDRIVVLGVERLDYTKGLKRRLRAIERLLERRSDLRRRLMYVQLATPSRERVPEYRDLRADIEREVGRINGRFTSPGHEVPIRYLRRQVSTRQLLAYYLAADVAMVTPLRDGMNLVAKEFVTVQAAAEGAGS